MFLHEVFRGRYHRMPAVTEFPNAERLNELMIVGPITVRSACSHHLVPILGKLWIGVLPSEQSNLIGLSKFSRIADWTEPTTDPGRGCSLADLPESRLAGRSGNRAEGSLCTALARREGLSHMTNSIMRAFPPTPSWWKEFLAAKADNTQV
jgi:GTP cyclohydrolase I